MHLAVSGQNNLMKRTANSLHEGGKCISMQSSNSEECIICSLRCSSTEQQLEVLRHRFCVHQHALGSLLCQHSPCCIRLGPDSNSAQLSSFYQTAWYTSLNRRTTKRQLLVHSLLWSETKMPGVIVLYIVQILGKSPREESSWNKDIWVCTGCRNNWFQRIMYKASCNKQ